MGANVLHGSKCAPWEHCLSEMSNLKHKFRKYTTLAERVEGVAHISDTWHGSI